MKSCKLSLLATITGIATFLLWSSSGHSCAQEQGPLDGAWMVISMEVDGAQIPEKSFKDSRLVIEGKTLKLLSEQKVIASGSVALDTTKDPKTITVQFNDGEGYVGKKTQGIYKIDKERLTICFTLISTNRARPSNFVTSPKSGLSLIEYHRAKK